MEINGKLKPLDIIKTPGGGIAIVSEVNENGGVSIDYFNNSNPEHEYNAWWLEDKLILIDSIPRILSNCMAHPHGYNKRQGDKYYSIVRM